MLQEAPCIGEGSGVRLDPNPVQSSAQLCVCVWGGGGIIVIEETYLVFEIFGVKSTNLLGKVGLK